MSACTCNISLGNTGSPTCEPIIDVIKKLIVVPYYDNDGAVNSVLLSTTLNAAYFTAKVNHLDNSKRWLPLGDLKNPTGERAESIFESFEDGSKALVREGTRSMAYIMPKKGTTLLSKIKGYRCAEVGVFGITKSGALVGMISADGLSLNPIKVDSSSWNPTYVFTNDTALQKINLAFDFAQEEFDEDIRMIQTSSMVGVNLISLMGLLDVNIAYSPSTVTQVVFTLTSDYGDAKNPVKVEGFDIADFTLTNTTTSAPITALTLTEAAGVYTITFAAQTSGNMILVEASKNGFDNSRLSASAGVVLT